MSVPPDPPARFEAFTRSDHSEPANAMVWSPGAAGPDSDAHATSSVRYANDATSVINTRFMACLPSASAAEWPALATTSREAAWWGRGGVAEPQYA